MTAPGSLEEVARQSAADVLAGLGSSEAGLHDDEAIRRLAAVGRNALEHRSASAVDVLLRQLKSPLLLLLVAAALVSAWVGEATDALIILGILSLSVGLGFLNEYRSERAVDELHARIQHRTIVSREGRLRSIDATELVPGDVVLLDVGDIVPADLRLLAVHALECDEAVLTGESVPAAKTAAAAPDAQGVQLPSCAFMGTVVRAGTGRAVVVATGARTAFGGIAAGLAHQHGETAFQAGLRRFSLLLVRVTAVLTVAIFVFNSLLGRSVLESALFSLAIAVGLTPQLLPAIVSISLSFGARRLAARSVLVKRLVAIEDLGNIEVLFTDKTGTLTEGRIRFAGADGAAGGPSEAVRVLGLLCSSAAVQGGQVVGGNPLDRALWEAAPASDELARYRRLGEAPFDYDRKLMSVLVEDDRGRRLIITKGAPEAVLERCSRVPDTVHELVDRQFAAGLRVVAVGVRDAIGATQVEPDDERELRFAGLLSFVDPPKKGARASLERLARLGVDVKIVTGDNALVARRVCAELHVPERQVLTGADLDRLDDRELAAALPGTGVFARVTPDQKSRVIRVQRAQGLDVGFLGDGVNDAVALHDADVGISVDSATDVAKDAADIVLLEKDLRILADGVVEGRRIFANTIKYVLMGTSSNFGNMFSAAGASVLLNFLPMTPTQILLNNLLYDVSEMTIPGDRVDDELLARPSHWDVRFIRRFMLVFGPVSSVFDFITFGVMLWVFQARDALFQTGWFVESLATQTLVIFVIRTRRVPFLRSRPARGLTAASLACVAAGASIPFTPLGSLFGFLALPSLFFGILGLMVLAYLALVETIKSLFFRPGHGAPLARRRPASPRRQERIAARFARHGLNGAARYSGLRRPRRRRTPQGVGTAARASKRRSRDPVV